MIHRLIDGEKEESFAGRLSRAGDEEDHGDNNIAKMQNNKSPYSTGERGNSSGAVAPCRGRNPTRGSSPHAHDKEEMNDRNEIPG